MDTFDIIIGGAGISGLTLAYYLNDSSFNKKKIAIIEDDSFNKKDNYISFWTNENYFFDSIITHQWKEIQTSFYDFKRKFSLSSYSYKLISSLIYKQFIIKQLSKNPNITFINDELLHYSVQNNSLLVTTKKNTYKTKLLFDSTYKNTKKMPFDHQLYMHAFTQEIKITKKQFNPSIMTFLDFRTNIDCSFYYCLPLTETHAIFQLTTISKAKNIDKKNNRNNMKQYLSNIQKLGSYDITNEQYGVIPLSDKKIERKTNQFVMHIGTNGGQVKPSTGFGFTRIHEDSKAIVNSLEQNNTPFYTKTKPKYYSLFDSILLEIITSESKRLEQIFKEIFKTAKDPEQIFDFLNEQSSLWEIVMLFKNLNYYPFIKAILSKNIYNKFVH